MASATKSAPSNTINDPNNARIEQAIELKNKGNAFFKCKCKHLREIVRNFVCLSLSLCMCMCVCAWSIIFFIHLFCPTP